MSKVMIYLGYVPKLILLLLAKILCVYVPTLQTHMASFGHKIVHALQCVKLDNIVRYFNVCVFLASYPGLPVFFNVKNSGRPAWSIM